MTEPEDDEPLEMRPAAPEPVSKHYSPDERRETGEDDDGYEDKEHPRGSEQRDR